jgi:hypothetical protein
VHDEGTFVFNGFRTRRLATALGLAALAAAAGVAIAGSSASAAGDGRAPQKGTTADIAYRCVVQQQSGAAGSINIKTNNSYNTLTATGWQTAACTAMTITVPRGERTTLDARYSGEFDAAGGAGWVQSRIWVVPASTYGAVTTREPDNTDRGDSFALDNGVATGDWNAHIQEQGAYIQCSPNAPTTGCPVRVYVQLQLTAGATSAWYDDTNLTVTTYDATYWGTPIRALVTP